MHFSSQSLHHGLQENSVPPSRCHHHCYNMHAHAGNTPSKKDIKTNNVSAGRNNKTISTKFTKIKIHNPRFLPYIGNTHHEVSYLHLTIHNTRSYFQTHKENDFIKNNHKINGHFSPILPPPFSQAKCGPDTALTAQPWVWVRVRVMFTNPYQFEG